MKAVGAALLFVCFVCASGCSLVVDFDRSLLVEPGSGGGGGDGGAGGNGGFAGAGGAAGAAGTGGQR
jgi:hypothetical protein